jgi:hypothetical protein
MLRLSKNSMPNWRPTDYLDRKGNPAIHVAGNHGYVLKIDEKTGRSNAPGWTPMTSPWGIEFGMHRWVAKYDAHNNMLEKAFFDTDLKPIAHPEGNHRFVNAFDAAGHLIAVSYFGIRGEPVLWNGEYHKYVTQYDGDFDTSESWFGVSGEPINNVNGFHKMETVYDDMGRRELLTFSGPEGKEAAKLGFRTMKIGYHPDLFTVATKTYADSAGKVVDVQHFDENGKPAQ